MQKTLSFSEIEDSIRKNPCLEDVKDERDLLFSEIMGGDVVIPKAFSLRGKMTHVKNQGSRGTCVGFASTGVTEFFNSEEYKNRDLNLSEEYLFKRIKEIDIADYNYDGYGAHLRSGAKALQKFGTCLEKNAPYNFYGAEKSWKDFQRTPEMDLEAQMYRMNGYVKVNKNVDEIIRALLTTGSPLLMGVTLHESYRQAKTNGGIVPVPKAGEARIGGHAMLFTGFKFIDDYLLLECKNSWGEGWGDEGYVWWSSKNLSNVFHSIWGFVDFTENPDVIEERLIEANKKLLYDYQKASWDKAIDKGLITSGTRPTDVMTKGDYFVFLDRKGDLG
jgi:C1A family cysteine protease